VTKPRHLLLTVALVALCALGFAAPASAHNSLVSSDPADGATLDAAPTQMAFRFDKSVRLDTISVELIDASGVRTEVAEFAYGPSGDTEVIATLPALGAGEVTVRWRLVGPDGHPITGRASHRIRYYTVWYYALVTSPSTERSQPHEIPPRRLRGPGLSRNPHDRRLRRRRR